MSRRGEWMQGHVFCSTRTGMLSGLGALLGDMHWMAQSSSVTVILRRGVGESLMLVWAGNSVDIQINEITNF